MRKNVVKEKKKVRFAEGDSRRSYAEAVAKERQETKREPGERAQLQVAAVLATLKKLKQTQRQRMRREAQKKEKNQEKEGNQYR